MNLSKKVAVVLSILIGLIIIVSDIFVGMGVSFFVNGDSSLRILLILFITCSMDLIGILIAPWKTRVSFWLITLSIVGVVLYEVAFFIGIHQLPTAKILVQDAVFISLKGLFALSLLVAAKHPREELKAN